MAKAKSKAKKIVWAFDPFDKQVGESAQWHKFIELLAKTNHSAVEPVYILSPDGMNWTGDFSGPWVKRYEPMARAAAQSSLQGFAEGTMAPLKVLVNPKMSLRRDVAKMGQYAKQQKASLILLKTQARRGMERWVLGSFAESLLLSSKIPVLAINPHTQPPSKLTRILFPTDLSQASKRAYKKVLDMAKVWGAEVVLCHKLPDPLEPIVQSGVYMAGGGWISLSAYFEKEAAQRRAQLAKWQAEGEKAKVKVTLHVIDKPGLVADSIMEAASVPGIDLIALSSQATATSSVLIGSVARQLLRAAHMPVMVFHGV